MRTIYSLPLTSKEDLERFRAEAERFKAGATSPIQFRSFRVTQGVYEQREEGAFMLRVRLPGGAVLPHEMRALASVARKYGNGVVHVTTRQDVQIHRVLLDSVHPALLELYEAGLSTKGGGGNGVRNITACHDAGVCAREAFDVSPYAVALTEFLLGDSVSFNLPRKFKIAFSGCSQDCAGATVNDVGFIAKKRGNELGFAAYMGGGMGAHSRVADLLEDFVHVEDIHFVAEAVKRVFDKRGNRRNRHRARLRFLVEQLGFERFGDLYDEELLELHRTCLPSLRLRDIPTKVRRAAGRGVPPHTEFDVWRERNAVPQKQDGFYLVHIPLILGDIAADKLEKLADVVEAHGEGMVRATQWQNLVIRWVQETELSALHRKLLDQGLAETAAAVVRNIIACAGASTCKLGICLSRALTKAIISRLNDGGLDLEKLGELNIHVSGCPNACGRHPVGQVGLFGAARRVNGRLVPHYVVQLGGKVTEGETRLARGKEAIPARNVPSFVSDLLRAYEESSGCRDFDAFIEAEGEEIAGRLIAKYKHVPPFEEDKNYYFDWGAETPFSLAGRGPGECGAGVFDVIEVDLASAQDALREGKLLLAAALAARALLVTRGQEARDDAEAFELFERHFIDAGVINGSFRASIQKGRRVVLASKGEEAFGVGASEVSALIEAVQNLYEAMDDSLRVESAVTATKPQQNIPCCVGVTVDREADFHGVTCPLNYVKTKLLLENMGKGQVLSVLLDREGARNVPRSAQQDGHEVLCVKQEGDQWRVLIRRS